MEKVAKKILDDAEEERGKIIKEAKKSVAKITKNIETELKHLKEETKRLVKEAQDRECRRLVGLANLELRNEALRAKREIIDTVFADALEHLLARKREDYLDLIKLFLERTGLKDGEIIVSEEERYIDEEFLKAMNEKLKADFKLSKEKGSMKGGFILHKDKLEIDCSFEALLNEKREVLEVELAKMLFK